MVIPTNIHTLLSGNVVEWARIEFKTAWDPETSLKTITHPSVIPLPFAKESRAGSSGDHCPLHWG